MTYIKDLHPVLCTGSPFINSYKVGSPGYVVAAATLCAAITTEVDQKKLLHLHISAWFHIVSKRITAAWLQVEVTVQIQIIRSGLSFWKDTKTGSIYHIVQHRHLCLDSTPWNFTPHKQESWFVKQLLSESADLQGMISCRSASSIETRHTPMHLLRGPSEDLTGQFLSTWRRSCMSRCWEHSRARKHVPRGKRSWRCAQCKQRKGSTLKRKRGEVLHAQTTAKRLHRGIWFVKSTGLLLRLFPKSLFKEPNLLAHKNGLFQERYRGPNPLPHTCWNVFGLWEMQSIVWVSAVSCWDVYHCATPARPTGKRICLLY